MNKREELVENEKLPNMVRLDGKDEILRNKSAFSSVKDRF